MFDICIIGGGASGLAAAITAAETNQELKILLLEKKEKTGRKIIASGNGKCNLSNVMCKNYNKTEHFFNKLGLITRQDSEGRVYPYTEESKAVHQALYEAASERDVKIITNCEVTEIERKETFKIYAGRKNFECRKLLIATGGKSAPQFGTTGDGYKFARKLGHNVTKLIPVLTAVDIENPNENFAGIRAKGEVSLLFKGNKIFSEKGEIQFTKTGISGICVFNLSRYLIIPEGCSFKDGFKDYDINIDFLPDENNVEEILKNREMLKGFSNKNVLKYIVRDSIADEIYRLSSGNIDNMAKLLKAFPVKPVSVKGWNFAQVTKGGVPLEEINTETMESLIIENLYFAGEVTDYDGPCGGYNLQNAWETGIKAGKGMADE